MRTTLTLNDETAALLKAELKRSKTSLKEVVNRALKLGLTQGAAKPQRLRIETKPHHGGKIFVPGISNIGEIMTLLDEKELSEL